jgi:tRNA pseudouridine synthase
VEASGFLYNQVRHMTGALIAVGLGSVPASAIDERLQSGSLKVPGDGKWPLHRGSLTCVIFSRPSPPLITSPVLLRIADLEKPWVVAQAKGLSLVSVRYPPHSDLNARMHHDIDHDAFGRPVFLKFDTDAESSSEEAGLQTVNA